MDFLINRGRESPAARERVPGSGLSGKTTRFQIRYTMGRQELCFSWDEGGWEIELAVVVVSLHWSRFQKREYVPLLSVSLSLAHCRSLWKTAPLPKRETKFLSKQQQSFFSLSLFLSPATPSFLFLSLLPLVILTIHIVPVSLNEYCIVHCTRSTTCIYYYYYYYSIGVFFPGLLSSPMWCIRAVCVSLFQWYPHTHTVSFPFSSSAPLRWCT